MKRERERLQEAREGRVYLACDRVAEIGERLAHSGFLATDSAEGKRARLVLVRNVHSSRGKRTADAVLEQVAMSCLECGKFELAEACIKRLEARYGPTPARMIVLKGASMEAHGRSEAAEELYTRALANEPHLTSVRKRLIGLLLSRSDDDSKGIDMLVEYVDTYYHDSEAWSTLADAYAQLGMLDESLTALSHVVLLRPKDALARQAHAETCYALGRYETSLKESLRVIEMCDGVVHSGPSRRAAFLALQSIRHLDPPGRPIAEIVKKLLFVSYGELQSRTKELVKEWSQLS